MMKYALRSQILALLMVTAMVSSISTTRAQGILGIGSSGISGLPDTTHFGDTIQGMGVWLQNQGLITYTSGLVTFLADPNNLGLPTTIGSLDLTGLLLLPGDSVYVPLDAFIVSPQSSNSGSNIMVIWPTSPGSQPGDTAHGNYYVDGPTSAPAPLTMASAIHVHADADNGRLSIRLPENKHYRGELHVVDMQGRRLVSHAMNGATTEIEVGALPTGIYLLEWTDATGQAAAVKFHWSPN